jgi:REP element-mobilizing transposase RayT
VDEELPLGRRHRAAVERELDHGRHGSSTAVSDTDVVKRELRQENDIPSTTAQVALDREYGGRVGRAPREFIPGSIYHVFSRGSNRQSIFAIDSDRMDFLDCLARVVRDYELICLAYCLMPNHYHFLFEIADESLSNAMKALNGRYSLRFNQRWGRDAHLFRNRFGAVLQETDEQLLWTVRYIARNPVESGLCSKPEEWVWSSHSASAGLARPTAFLSIDRLLAFFGDEPATARSRYCQFVKDTLTPSGV